MRSQVTQVMVGVALLAISTPASALLHLTGRFIDLPIDTTMDVGRFMAEGDAQGVKFNPNGTGGVSGIDFWVWGAPVYNYTIAINGSPGVTNGVGWDSGPTVTDTSSGNIHSAEITGSPFPDVLFNRVVSFADTDRVITITDTIASLSDATLTQVATLDNTDPDQGTPLGAGSSTSNDVTPNSVVATVTTAGFPNGLSVAFRSQSPLAVFDASGFSNIDPYGIISSPADPNGAFGDIGIDIAFNYGSLSFGQSRSVTWQIVFTGEPFATSAPALSPGALLIAASLMSAIGYWALGRRTDLRTR